jgi:lipoate synthase
MIEEDNNKKVDTFNFLLDSAKELTPKVPSFLTWELLLSLIPDTKDMLVDVAVNSNILVGTNFVKNRTYYTQRQIVKKKA